ncbi:hypothetical protein SBY92_001793 [Candida maltosa Xu316]
MMTAYLRDLQQDSLIVGDCQIKSQLQLEQSRNKWCHSENLIDQNLLHH